MSTADYDLVVVGAGIVGSACAYLAASEGLRVAVVDGQGAATGATGAAMGHLVALDGSDAELELCRWSLQLWQELSPQLPPTARYRPAGTIWLAEHEEDISELRRKSENLRRHDVPCTPLDPDELRVAEPALREGLAGGLLVPGDALIEPVGATQHFLAETTRRGGRVVIGSNADRITDGRVLLGSGETLRAAHVLNATGVDAARLSKGIPVRPRKGVLLRFDGTSGPLRHQLVEVGYGSSVRSAEPTSVAFNAHPASDGSWTIGASREWGSADRSVQISTVERIRNRAIDFLPQIAGVTVAKSWAGLRPAMPDHLPWVGRLPGSDSVWVATGHEGLGITCSIGTARLIVDGILDRRSEISADAYRPSPSRAAWPAQPPGG